MPYVQPDPAAVEAAGQALLTAFAQRVAERANPTPRPPGHSPSDMHSRVCQALHQLHGRLPRLNTAAQLLCLFLKGHSWKAPRAGVAVGLKASAVARGFNVLRKLGLVERQGNTSTTYYWLTVGGELLLLETLPPPALPEAPIEPVEPAAPLPALPGLA